MSNNHPIVDVLTNINSQSCPRSINFHCHTTSSDGSMDAIELIKQASTLGLRHLAITDHHSIQAHRIISSWLTNKENTYKQLKVWTGIEISSLLSGCLVHILALGFEIDHPDLFKYSLNQSTHGIDLKSVINK